ncbi:MAG: hypothetical protein IPJ13_06625 [Saprospiraceae bacterium]|nr:hypothetical protein [Saprospiraceae bacterium]
MKKVILIILLLLLKLSVSHSQQCVDTVHLKLDPVTTAEYIDVKVLVKGFKDLVSFQYALNYDADILKFDKVLSNLPEFNVGNFFDDKKGKVRLLWTKLLSTVGTTLPENAVLMTLRFQKIKFGGVSSISLSDLQFFEFTRSDNKSLCFTQDQVFVPSEEFKISGKVIFDQNDNCRKDVSEQGISGWLVEFEKGTLQYYQITDAQGNYSSHLPKGTYRVKVSPKNESWSLCLPEQTVNIEDKDIFNLDFIAKNKILCPQIKVDISTPSVIHCKENIYTLIYQNQGTEAANNLKIDVTFSKYFTYIKSDRSPLTINENTLQFDLGNLLPLQKDTIRIVFKSDCDQNSIGRTYCISARVSPVAPCTPVPAWSGADLQVTPHCDESGKKVQFIIKNTGTNDMLDIRHYIVTEEDVLRPSQPFKLDKQKELKIELPADGTTYRLTADQDKGYPYRSVMVSAAIEGCCTNNSGSYSKGFVTQFEETDRDIFSDTDCRESDTKLNPIDITGMPKGYGTEHYIKMDAYPEFVFSFNKPQMTDKIHSVIIKTKINEAFDISTLELGASSHPYRIFIHEERELVFVLDSIAPGLSTEYQGFVKYKIKVSQNAKPGTIIENSAKIFFNFGDPIASTTQFYTLGESFILSQSSVPPEHKNINLYPNPAEDVITVDIPQASDKEFSFSIQTMEGKILDEGKLVQGQNILSTNRMFTGLNILYIRSGFKSQSVYKIIKL